MVFQHIKISKRVFKLGHTEDNLSVIKQVFILVRKRFSIIAYAKCVVTASSYFKTFFGNQLFETNYFANFVTENHFFSTVSLLLPFFNFKTFSLITNFI